MVGGQLARSNNRNNKAVLGVGVTLHAKLTNVQLAGTKLGRTLSKILTIQIFLMRMLLKLYIC